LRYIFNIKPPFKKSLLKYFSDAQLLALCKACCLPQIFQAREEEMYLIRLSKSFERWNKSHQVKKVINDTKIAKINQQSAEAV